MEKKRTLVLVRHAAAAPTGYDGDLGRPLVEQGTRDALEVAQQIKGSLSGGRVILVSSPALRAVQTAQVFARVLGVPSCEILTDLGYYRALSPDELLAPIRTLSEEFETVFLFAHEPVVSEAAWMLLGGKEYHQFPPATAMVLDYGDGGYSGKGRRVQAKLRFYLVPRRFLS